VIDPTEQMKLLNKRYLDEEITLKEYEALKFPERTKRKLIESMKYPLPIENHMQCIICGGGKKGNRIGVVKCHTCENMICKQCIIHVFHPAKKLADLEEEINSQRKKTSKKKKQNMSSILSIPIPPQHHQHHSTSSVQHANHIEANPMMIETMREEETEVEEEDDEEDKRFETSNDGRQESFLLIHHKYCMKLGELPEIKLDIEPDDAYIREFRQHSRLAILQEYQPKFQADANDLDDSILQEIQEEENQRKLMELQRLQFQRELMLAKLARENPPYLQEKRAFFEEKVHKYDKMKKEIIRYQQKILDHSHTEQFIARNMRLKNEMISKVIKSTQRPLTELYDELSTKQEEIPGEFLPQLLQEIMNLQQDVESLIHT
jgi:hypothetical protein